MFTQSVQAIAIRGIEVVAKLILYLMAARLLGALEAGLFFICLTWAHLLSTAARFGVDRAIMRHVAAELGIGNFAGALRNLRIGAAIVTPPALLAGGLTWFLAAPLASNLFDMPALGAPLAATAFLIVPQTIAFYLCSALVGFGRPIGAHFFQFAFWPVIGIAAMVAGTDSALGLISALALGMAAVLCISGILVLRQISRHRESSIQNARIQPMSKLPSLWRTARPLLMVEIIQVSIANLPVLVLATVADEAMVGAFSLAMRISMIVWMAIISLGTVAAPKFADLHRRDDKAALASLNRRVMLAGAVCGGMAALTAIIFSKQLLSLFGDEYQVARTALMILAAGQLVNAIFCCQDVLLAMSGYGRLLSRVSVMQLVSGCILMIVLVPLFQATGAAISVALVTAFGALATSASVRALMDDIAIPGAPALPKAISLRIRALGEADIRV